MGQGDFYLRLGPEKLAEVRKAAEDEGVSMSDFIREGVDLKLERAGFPRSVSRADVLAEIAEIAAKLRSGFTLVPSAEAAGPGSWSEFMDGEAP